MNRLNVLQHMALSAAEWADNRNDSQGPFCVVCGRYQRDGHVPDCAVGAALAAYRRADDVEALLAPAPRQS